MRRRTLLIGLGAGGIAVVGGLGIYQALRFPPDTTPEGAYLRIATNIANGNIVTVFSYLEDAAQHAAFTLRDYRRQAVEQIVAHYPEPERSVLFDKYRAEADADDGADIWVMLAEQHGWIGRLRQDLSGIKAVERTGPRATVITARDTRYPFRERHNGMWGLTLFTAAMVAEAERAARDFDVVKAAAEDYRRAK